MRHLMRNSKYQGLAFASLLEGVFYVNGLNYG